MLRRLALGLVFGLIIGGALAFGLVRMGEGVLSGTEGDALAYLSSAVAGALTGMVAGKPIWASGAKIEAGLKAFFGALLAAGAMYAVRRWAAFEVPSLGALGGSGHDVLGDVPMASLPLIAAGLGAIFGLDDTGDPKKDEGARPRKRVAAVEARPSAKSRVADSDEAEDSEPAGRRAKR